MKHNDLILVIGFLVVEVCWVHYSASSAAPLEPLAIPLKPDPPPAVDGELREWASVPNAVRIDRPEQAVYGRGKWTSPADLSATIWLAWRGEYLFLAADV